MRLPRQPTSLPRIIFKWRKVWDSNPRGTLLTPLLVFKTNAISQTLPTFHDGGKYRSRTCSPFPMPLISNQADYRSRNLPYGELTGNRTHDLKDENLLSYPLDDKSILELPLGCAPRLADYRSAVLLLYYRSIQGGRNKT